MKLSPGDQGGVEVEYKTGLVVFFYQSIPVAARLGPQGPILVCIDIADSRTRTQARSWVTAQQGLGKIKVTLKLLRKITEIC